MLIIVVEVDDERGVVGGEMVWRGGGLGRRRRADELE